MTADPRSLEARLRSAAMGAAWPPTPDLRPGVLARIAAPDAERSAASGSSAGTALPRPVRRGTLVRALALAVVALLVLVAAAVALGFRLPGLDIVFTDRPPVPSFASADLVPGSPVPLAEVRGGGSPRVLVPAALPEPSTAFVEGTGDARIVTLVWEAAPGEPALERSNLSVVLMAAPGRIERPMLSKTLGPGSTVEPVAVGQEAGWWIAGAPHLLMIVGPDGQPAPMRSRLAGDTLVFARDGTVYRLESALGRDATLALAATLR